MAEQPAGDERLVSPLPEPEGRAFDQQLRPYRLDDYIGQPVLRRQLEIFLQAAQQRGEPLDHTLLFGPPGLGKTTLGYIIAHEMGAQIRTTSGPVLERAGDLAAILTNLAAGDVLFIDEIHRLRPQIEEILYPAMEDRQLDIVIGEGPAARSVKLELPPFTLVGATTRAGRLGAPLRDRFGISQRLEFYAVDDLAIILERSARLCGVDALAEGLTEIATRARGTPRIANRLLRRVRDYAEVEGEGRIDTDIAVRALDMLKVNRDGLDSLDRRLLKALIGHYGGGPVGVESLAVMLGEERDTLEEVVEPYLMQQGFLARTARGRVAAARAYRLLGLEPPPTASGRQTDLGLAGDS